MALAADAFAEAEVPYSFGGAIALGYYAPPRQTHDIDINVFMSVAAVQTVMDVLTPLGVESLDARALRGLEQSSQIRLDWQGTPLDLFFSNLPFHDSCMARRQREMFGEREIPVLGAEDLIVCKVAFGRPKDRDDIREMLRTVGHELDFAYIRKWIAEFLATSDERYRDFEVAMTEQGLEG